MRNEDIYEKSSDDDKSSENKDMHHSNVNKKDAECLVFMRNQVKENESGENRLNNEVLETNSEHTTDLETTNYDTEFEFSDNEQLDIHNHVENSDDVHRNYKDFKIIDMSDNMELEYRTDKHKDINENKMHIRQYPYEDSYIYADQNVNKLSNETTRKYDLKQSNMRKGFNANDTYIIEEMHLENNMHDNNPPPVNTSILERDRLTDRFFEAISFKKKRFEIRDSSKQNNILYHLLRYSNREADKLGLDIEEEQDLYLFSKNMRDYNSTKKRKRGRPPIMSSELASSDFDENGIKVDSEGGCIDFDDSLFDTRFEDNKEVYYCKLCYKAFPSKSRGKRHYIIHTDYKPFKCGNLNCNKRFSRRDNMLQHERMHCSAVRKKNSGNKK